MRALTPCLRIYRLIDSWDTSALRALVDERCQKGRKPSHLLILEEISELD